MPIPPISIEQSMQLIIPATKAIGAEISQKRRDPAVKLDIYLDDGRVLVKAAGAKDAKPHEILPKGWENKTWYVVFPMLAEKAVRSVYYGVARV